MDFTQNQIIYVLQKLFALIEKQCPNGHYLQIYFSGVLTEPVRNDFVLT